MQPQVPIPKEKLVEFCKTHHISKLAFFGSVLTDHFAKTSDIDILVEFESGHTPSLFKIADFEEELASIVGREVDLRTPEDLSSYFRNHVISQVYQLYGQERFKSS